MGDFNQLAYLEDILESIEKKNKKYRELVSNKQTHTLHIRSGDLTHTIRQALQGYEPSVVSDFVNNFVRSEAQKMITRVNTRIEARIRAEDPSFKVTRQKRTRDHLVAVFHANKEKSGIYERIVREYNDDLQIFVNNVVNRSRELDLKLKSEDKGQLFNLAHEDKRGILETQMRINVDRVSNGYDVDPKVMRNYMNSAKLDVTLIRDTANLTSTVSIASKISNRDDGNDVQNEFRKLKKQLQEDIRKLKQNEVKKIAGLPGSDSFEVIMRKKTIKSLSKAFSKLDNADLTFEDFTVKKKKTVIKKSVQSKLNKGKNKKVTTKVPRGKPSRRGDTSPVRLMALINARLPETVAKNMGSPRLENRTGRFASSPRVVDVQTTNKGFLSFGYTYQKNPYSVFERTSGSRFASAERDPRDLIDLSIREIAQQLMAGRFYTRRV